jgi:hypothetical protein
MTAMAGFGNTIASAFAMSDRVWERHANPWSVWTRVASAPLPFVAIGSHAWLGWPLALILFAAVACWLWFNPRVFPPPISTNNWSSKAVLGERVWLNRSRFPIPGDHATAATLLGDPHNRNLLPSCCCDLCCKFSWCKINVSYLLFFREEGSADANQSISTDCPANHTVSPRRFVELRRHRATSSTVDRHIG